METYLNRPDLKPETFMIYCTMIFAAARKLGVEYDIVVRAWAWVIVMYDILFVSNCHQIHILHCLCCDVVS